MAHIHGQCNLLRSVISPLQNSARGALKLSDLPTGVSRLEYARAFSWVSEASALRASQIAGKGCARTCVHVRPSVCLSVCVCLSLCPCARAKVPLLLARANSAGNHAHLCVSTMWFRPQGVAARIFQSKPGVPGSDLYFDAPSGSSLEVAGPFVASRAQGAEVCQGTGLISRAPKLCFATNDRFHRLNRL